MKKLFKTIFFGSLLILKVIPAISSNEIVIYDSFSSKSHTTKPRVEDYPKIMNIVVYFNAIGEKFDSEQHVETSLTPTEANIFFRPYVRRLLIDSSYDNLNRFFSAKHFGLQPTKQLSPEQILREANLDVLLVKNLRECFFQSKGRPIDMEQAFRDFGSYLSLVDPRILLLDEKTVYQWYLRREPHHRNKMIHCWSTEAESRCEDTNSAHFLARDIAEKEVDKLIHEIFFSHKYFGFPRDKIERKKHFLTRRSFSFLDQDSIRGIFDSVVKMGALSQPGDYFVFFGNTPYYPGRAFQQLYPDRRTIFFPFSGSPNRKRAGSLPTTDDDVNLYRLAHLRGRLRICGLSSANSNLLEHNVYFVDVIGSGRGPAYTIEEVLLDFRKRRGTLPNIATISLNRIDIHSKRDHGRNASIAKSNSNDKGVTRLFFPDIHQPRFSVMNYEVFLPEHYRLDFLRHPLMRRFPSYNPCYWNRKDEAILLKPKTIPEHTQILFEYFDVNIQKLKKSLGLLK